MITAKIASIPERMSQLELTVNFFLNHVDKLEVYLNNYPKVPVFLKNPKIQIFTSQENGDRGDVGKFYQVESARGYILTIDDDLIYPQDYISTMIKKIDHYERKALICVHANLLPKYKLSSYYQDKLGVHFEKKLENDTRVDIPGTGTLGFHTDTIKLTQQIFLVPNMTDIWLAVYARENNIPIISIERQDNWLLQARGEAFNRSIYKTSFKNDSYQTGLLNKFFFTAVNSTI